MNPLQLQFTQPELQAINDALMLLAYGRAAPVVQSINRQIQAQFDAAREAETPVGGQPLPTPDVDSGS